MAFADRAAAGRALAERLGPDVSPATVVAGIQRGGLVVALPIVQRLGLPLAVVYARKLTSSVAPEVAWGALDEDGEILTDPPTMAALGVGPAELEAARARVAGEIRRRMARYGVPPLGGLLPGRELILVDDGLATGLTMRAAVACARRHGAGRITVAVPCAAAEAAARLEREADRLVALVVDDHFLAVGAHYEDFSPVTDEQVISLLARARGIAPRERPPGAGLRLSFKNSRGLRLAGNLALPEGDGPFPVVLLVPGRSHGEHAPWARAAAGALREAGIAAFLLDFAGQGDSEGSAAEAPLGQEVDDLRAAMDVLEGLDEIDPGRIGLSGAGAGIAVARSVAAEDARVRALALGPAGAEAVPPGGRVPILVVAAPGGASGPEADPAGLAGAATHIATWFRRQLG